VCPYEEILSASDRSSLFFFRSARLARASSVSKARTQIAAIPKAEMINATHQRRGIEEKTLVRKFMGLFDRMESDAERIPRHLHDAKITKVGAVEVLGSTAKILTRHWLLYRDHRFRFRLCWNDDPSEQVRDDAQTNSGSERDEEAEDAHEGCVKIEVLS
jgi:hypothetical protein